LRDRVFSGDLDGKRKEGYENYGGEVEVFFYALGEVIWWDSNVGGRITMLVVGWVSSYHHELHHRHRYSISIFLYPPPPRIPLPSLSEKQ